MKNKKGFTLIELLAVIVVLAIIALIATPIVMNTIKNAKKGAAERSADNYIKQVETAVAEAKLENRQMPDGEYTIDEDGNLTRELVKDSNKCALVDTAETYEEVLEYERFCELETKVFNIEISGNKPSGGTVIISNGGISQTGTTLTIGEYPIVYRNGKMVTIDLSSELSTSTCVYISGEAAYSIGSQYICGLDKKRTFYVLETSGDNVSLIMDRNFTDDTVSKTLAWCIDGGSDGATCKNINSKEEGTPLKHIQDTFGENVTVSFPTKKQIEGAYTDLMPKWLRGSRSDNNYWTSSIAQSSGIAWLVNSDGFMDYPVNGNIIGVRPVITVSKSQLG